MKRKILLFLPYIIYAIFFSLLVLVVNFPYDKLEYYLAEKIQIKAGIRPEIGKIGYAWPLGLYAENITAYPVHSSDSSYFEASIIKCKLKPLGLLTGKIRLDIFSKTSGGEILGDVRVKDLWKDEHSAMVNIKWTDIHSGSISLLTDLVSSTGIGGITTGSLTFKGNIARAGIVSGEGSLEFEGLNLNFDFPLVKIRPVHGVKTRAEYKMASQQIEIVDGSLAADDVEAKFSGQVSLGAQLPSSRLDVRGQVRIRPDLIDMSTLPQNIVQVLGRQRPIGFSIGGTLQKPAFSVN